MASDHITKTLAIRDYVLFRVGKLMPLNATVLAEAFGISGRQAKRYITAINAHYGLRLVYDFSRKTYRRTK